MRMLKGGRLHITFDRIRLEGEEQKIAVVMKSASDFTRDEKVKSDPEGTLKAGADGGKVVDNVVKGAEIGGAGVTIAILSGIASSNGGGIPTGAAVGGLAVLGGSMVAGGVLSKGRGGGRDRKA